MFKGNTQKYYFKTTDVGILFLCLRSVKNVYNSQFNKLSRNFAHFKCETNIFVDEYSMF